MNNYEFVNHPSTTVHDICIQRNITIQQLQENTNTTELYLNGFFAGQAPITIEFALALSAYLDIEFSFWLNLQANYDKEILDIKQRLADNRE